MSKLSPQDLEAVEGTVEFAGYMVDRVESQQLSKAFAEMEKNWTLVLYAARGNAGDQNPEAVAA